MAASGRLSPVPPPERPEQWEELSPDGLTRVHWAVSHGRISHEMITPQLYDATTGASILALDSSFDGQIRWGDDARFVLHLRHYIRSGATSLEIDRKAARFRFLEEGVHPGSWHPIDRISPEVEGRFTPSNEELNSQALAFWARIEANKPKTLPQPWGFILFVLMCVGCILIIAVVLFLAFRRILG